MEKYTLEEFNIKLMSFTGDATERKRILATIYPLVTGSRIYKIDNLYLCDMINCINSVEIEIEYTKDGLVCKTLDDKFLIVKD